MRPACWKAHGKETTAVPISVFQTENMITIELYFLSTSSITQKETKCKEHDDVKEHTSSTVAKAKNGFVFLLTLLHKGHAQHE